MLTSLRLPALPALLLFIALSVPAAAQESSSPRADVLPPRIDRGLLVLYDFAEGNGRTIHDRAGVGQPLDLTIETPSSVSWSEGSLTVTHSARIRSEQPARRILDAVGKSNAISVEAWIAPANTSQEGPARIVSISAGTSHRNFTLGQERDRYDVRLRSTSTSTNGLPSTSSSKSAVRPDLAHLTYTRDPSGAAVLYLNGRAIGRSSVKGRLSNWDASYRLSLGNETSGDRPWRGGLHLVAVYDRALSAQEVQQNFAAGSTAGTLSAEERALAAAEQRHRRVFETSIAPLLARHCLECHDPAIRKGGLDLSQRLAALKGGESGQAIVPGRAEASLLWERVESNDMPADRAPLSAEEKTALKNWLDDGAVWTTDVIDPANFLHNGRGTDYILQRLTLSEYIETVRSAVGVDITADARRLLPADLRSDGFSNTAYNLKVDLKHVDAYRELAALIVSRMDVPEFARRFSRSQRFDDDRFREFISRMGLAILRGPLDEREINLYAGVATTVSSSGGTYHDAVGYVIEAMLQSPRFLYRIESQPSGGSSSPVGPYELASRMSYVVWGGPPDQTLMDAAGRNELRTDEQIRAQVTRMLSDPRAIRRSREFVSEWLHLDRLADLQPDRRRYPAWNSELAADMRDETLAVFEELSWKQNRPLSDLLNVQYTFATPRLARHYGLEPAGDGLARIDLKSTPGRGGLLTHGSVLTIGGDEASMVSRGLFVLHDLLRGTVNSPPPCVNTTPPPTRSGLTQRGIAETRIANQNCGVCHSRFEPLAFGLEKFDGIGAFHERDHHGNRLRDDGEILFPGTAEAVPYRSSAELMNLLAGSDRVRESLTWKVTQFSLGRPLVAADAALITEVHRSAQAAGGTYADVISSLLLSDLVRRKGGSGP